jgi:hypothetical protein
LEIVIRLAEIRRRARKYKNSGNEAKKSLKTKDITILSGADYAHFRRKLAQIRRCEGARNCAFGAERSKADELKREAALSDKKSARSTLDNHP